MYKILHFEFLYHSQKEHKDTIVVWGNSQTTYQIKNVNSTFIQAARNLWKKAFIVAWCYTRKHLSLRQIKAYNQHITHAGWWDNSRICRNNQEEDLGLKHQYCKEGSWQQILAFEENSNKQLQMISKKNAEERKRVKKPQVKDTE
jgi:hypothetical protein